MRPRSLVSIFVLCTGLLIGGVPLDVQAADGASAFVESNAFVVQIRNLAGEARAQLSVAEAAEPARLKVANCLGQIARTLNSYEASAEAVLPTLNAAHSAGDAATVQGQFELLRVMRDEAKDLAAKAAACDTGSVDVTSSGGILGLDGLPSVVEGSGDSFLPDGETVGEATTLDVVTSPLVTP